MRLWSIHPDYLDRQGLLGVWREALLAQRVLLGETRAYHNHPQLIRFRQQKDPVCAIGAYLKTILEASVKRGYLFNAGLILNPNDSFGEITVTSGQLQYEWNHYLKKISVRDISLFNKFQNIKKPPVNPFFIIVEGDIENWEKIKEV